MSPRSPTRSAGRSSPRRREAATTGRASAGSTSPGELDDWLAAVGEPGPLADGVLLEEAVPFSREVAALVARNPSGEARAWPLVETVQEDGICTEVLAPAPGIDAAAAQAATDMALRIAEELGVTGVLAVELFVVVDEQGRPTFLVNELAMRPHNSGHWTIDGSVTSQFEQHLRAVVDLPLGATAHPGAVDGDGQRARAALARICTPRSAGCWPRTPSCASTCTARRSAPVARSDTSRSAATTSTTSGHEPCGPPTNCEEPISDERHRSHTRRRDRHGQRQRLAGHGAGRRWRSTSSASPTRPTSCPPTACPTT